MTRSLELKKNYKVRFRIIFSNLGNKIYNSASKLKYEWDCIMLIEIHAGICLEIVGRIYVSFSF